MLKLVYEYLMVKIGFPRGKVTFRIEYEDGTCRLRTVHYRRCIDLGKAANKVYDEDTYPAAIDDIDVAYLHGSVITE